MKLSGAKAAGFVARPSSDMRGALLYGPDSGLIAEMRDRLRHRLLAGDTDPFRLAEVTPDIARKTLSILLDECDALSFGGGDRIVICSEANDGVAPAAKRAIDEMKGAAFLIITAGALAPSSKLRKLFEGAQNAASLAFYPPEGADLEAALDATLTSNGARIEQDALRLASATLSGADYGALTRFAEILALSVDEGNAITAEQVSALAPVEGDTELDSLAQAVGRGVASAIPGLLRNVGGQTPASALRVCAIHLDRLARLQAAAKEAGSIERAVDSARPPIFFKARASIIAQAKRWRPMRLEAALSEINAAEAALRSSTPPPEDAFVERLLMRIAMMSG